LGKKALFFIVFAILMSGCTRAGNQVQVENPGSEQAVSIPTEAINRLQGSAETIPAASIILAAGGEKATLVHLVTKAEPGREIAGKLQSAGYSILSSSSPTAGIISIGGHVVNASGGAVPQNTFITLTIYENDQIVNQIKIPLDLSGSFQFNLVPWNPNFTYMASVVYNSIEFDSGLIDAGVLLPGMTVQIHLAVYEVSTDAQLLEALRMRVVYDFTTPGWVHIFENILISNPTSLVIVPPSDGSPILDFPLPKEATNVVFPDGNSSNRFRLTSTGFGDWQPVMPGDGHQVLVEYSVPFTSAWRCDLTTPLPLDSIMVMVKASRIVTSSNELQLSMVQNDSTSSISVYAASSIPSGEQISILFTPQDQIQRIWLGIGIFTVTILLALVYIIRSNQVRARGENAPAVAKNAENVDTILDAIIALDDRHRHGDIGEDAYQKARAEYVEKLEALSDHIKE